MSEKILLKAIREKCLWCFTNQVKEIQLCPIKDCPLYLYRLGKKPADQKKKIGFGHRNLAKNTSPTR